MTKDYLNIIKHEEHGSDAISMCFYIESTKILEIGDKMNEINPMAYMNGYNWEAILDYYLGSNHPELLEDLIHDPEAGMYVAVYEPINEKNEQKAEKLAKIIEDLIENEEKLYALIKEHGDEIEWD
ncbi:MAG: hypothetical protein JW891_07325 [Candidatus Lokiarchaeota archaeon]|nr:hypothetical protein [Candidatus Lokiarchaeota archaeon]